MANYVTSGSGFERLAHCPMSAALPHAHHETEYTQRGTAIHAFLEDVSKVGRAAALEVVDEEWRATCEAIVLDGLDAQLGLAAEVAFAYNVETDTCRELGRGEGRKYDDVTEDEIPTTLDVAGLRVLPTARRGLVVDWKSGWTTRRRIDLVPQMDVGSLVVSRAYDCDVVERQLVHVHEDIEPWVQRDVLDRWEIDIFAENVRAVWSKAKEVRAEMKAGRAPRDYNTGPWCERCPAREFCPAQTSMLRAVLGRDMFDGALRMDPIPESALVDVWHQLHEAQSVLKLLKGRVLGLAATRTLSLGKTPDGKDRWLGQVTAEGNEMLDGEVAYDVLSEMFDDEVATAATRVTATKKSVEAAIKQASPRGKAAGAMRTFLEKMRAGKGAGRRWSTTVKEYTTKPGAALVPASPVADALEPGTPDPAAEEFARDYYDESNETK